MALIDQDATIRALVQLHEETGVKTAQAIRVVREMPEADALSTEQTTQSNAPNALNILDCVSRQAAIDSIMEEPSEARHPAYYAEKIKQLPSAQPEIKPIEYRACAYAMLRMWMDKVVTDGEYNRIMDKLNAHWRRYNG